MDWLWTWGGVSFGYRVDDRVFTHFGLQIGRVALPSNALGRPLLDR